MVARKRVHKSLFYEDGRNRVAQLGMVDGKGCNCFMLDTEATERFEFKPLDWLMAEQDEEIQRLQAELARVRAELESTREHHGHMTRLCAALLEDGKFTRGNKGKFQMRFSRWRAR